MGFIYEALDLQAQISNIRIVHDPQHAACDLRLATGALYPERMIPIHDHRQQGLCVVSLGEFK